MRLPRAALRATHGAGSSRAVSDPFAEQPRGPEYEHEDEDQKGEYILVVRAGQNEFPAIRTALAERVRKERVGAEVGEVADVARPEGFNYAEQHAAQHRTGDIPDAAEHCG